MPRAMEGFACSCVGGQLRKYVRLTLARGEMQRWELKVGPT